MGSATATANSRGGFMNPVSAMGAGCSKAGGRYGLAPGGRVWSANIGVVRGARSDLEQVPAGYVVDERAAQPDGPAVRAGRVRVPVQQHGRPQRPHQPVQRPESAVHRVIVVVADATWRRVRDQHVDLAAIAQPAPARRGAQPRGPARKLGGGVLVGARAVAGAAAEPRYPQPGYVDDA